MEQLGWEVVLLQVSGRDAERYLHNRFTNNIRALPIGALQWNAALTPQGKTQAVFQVKRTSKDGFLLLADGGIHQNLTEVLLRFKVADQILVTAVPDQKAIWCTENRAEVVGVTRFDQKIGSRSGALLVGELNALTQIVSDTAIRDRLTFNFLNAEEKFPRFPTEISEKYLFSEAGFENAVSYAKGCFVGQEVVHKINAFATLPFEIGVAEFPVIATIAAGDKLQTEKGEGCGEILSVSSNGQRKLSFVRVRSEYSPQLRTVICKSESGMFLGVCQNE